jgi:replicative DNA helicase
LTRTVRRLRARGPEAGAKSVARLVVVDYLQAIPKPQRRGIGTPEAIGENAAALEDLAAREQIAVVLMSQVNDEPMRREKDHRPQLRDVAGSRDPAKGCKLALGLYRPHKYDASADPKAGEILVLKNAQGEAGVTVDILLDLATHTIRDAGNQL